ncbi:unnamed protein product, partial [Tenebrio molitor]
LSAHGKTKLFLKKDAIPTLRLPGNNENESNRHSLYQEKKSRKEIVDNAIASTSQQQIIFEEIGIHNSTLDLEENITDVET